MVNLPLLRHTREGGYPCFQLPIEATKVYGFPIKACPQLDWELGMTGVVTPLEQ